VWKLGPLRLRPCALWGAWSLTTRSLGSLLKKSLLPSVFCKDRGLFQQISTPAVPPRTRGKSPGWTKGRPRTRPERHKVVKKTKNKAKLAEIGAKLGS